MAYKDKNDSDNELCAPGLHGTPVPIQQLEVSDAIESLGIWITVNSNQKRQYKELLKKSRAFASQIYSSSCDENPAPYAYDSSVLKFLEYTMEVTSFTDNKRKIIIRPTLTATLCKAKMQLKLHSDIL